MQQRLDKAIASQGSLSRSDVHELIRKGLVRVNNNVCTKKDFKIDTDIDTVEINGKRADFTQYIYIMLNKPKGVLSASEDKKATTVIDLVPDGMKRKNLFPAGRLDKDTTGLLIITNDGDYAHRMLSPKKHVDKVYHAVIEGRVGEKEILAFERGVRFEDGFQCLPAKLKVIDNGDNQTCEVTIREGKFHQVKKMFLAVGCRVLELKRVKIGALKLDENLKSGECKILNKNEYNSVFIKE
ncbi:MAG: pseudouridine synthase [Acutalibacteraceae bacterium]